MQLLLLLNAYVQRLAYIPIKILFSIQGSVTIQGRQHIARHTTPLIFASNHISELDPVLIVTALPFFSRHLPLIFVSREKSFYNVNWRKLIYGGIFFKILGAYPAYVGLNDYAKALKHHLQVLSEGRSVCIFPMGGIKPRGEPLKAKGGVLYLAHATKSPIVPVKLEKLHSKTVITFGAPLHASELLKGKDTPLRTDFEEASAVLMEKINQLT